MSQGPYDVYGVGNALIDLQLSVSDEEFLKLSCEVPSLEKGGMRLVEVEEQVGLLERFADRKQNMASGGSAANTIIAVQQLGGQVAYGCSVGEDHFGEFYLKEMADLGVELRTRPVKLHATGTCIILITPDSERTMNTHLGASVKFSAEHVEEEIVKQASWIYVEGYLFSSDLGRESALAAIALAKRHGVKVAVTFSDGFIVSVFGDALREAVSQADLIFANFSEACAFTGLEGEQEVFSSLSKTVANFAVTLGAEGAFVVLGGEEVRIPGVKVRAVDTTGAGDMFAAGFLYGITHGLSAEQSGKLACRLAAEVVSQLGPRLAGDLSRYVAEL